ncbi:MAG TPA: chloride channel protein [Novosphingobium sp.]|nr:chloride channel protein [Novosphingobium sp.]
MFHLPRLRSVARQRLAALLGAILLGLFAVAFARAAEAVQAGFDGVVQAWPLAPLVFTPAIFALAAALTGRFAPEAAGSGIPQVIVASHAPRARARGPLVSLRTAAAKFAGTLVMLASGAAVGREGPTVQISAGIMVAVHRWLRVPVTAGVMIAGGAAGVAAAFNTPVAGVAFAIEELASAFEQKVAGLVMLAVVAAGLVSLGLNGDYVYFGRMTGQLPLPEAIGGAVVTGICGGAAGGLFSRMLVGLIVARAGGIVARLKARPVLFALGGGGIVALLGVGTGGLTWGTGYGATRALLSGGTVSDWFFPARVLATLVSGACGAPGGIFAPSLAVGAGLGRLLAAPFADGTGTIVLLGMIAYFTGAVRAPLTAVIIVMEMTASRAMILPLFATALIADQVSAIVCPDKLYHALARGVRAEPGPSGRSAPPTSAS